MAHIGQQDHSPPEESNGRNLWLAPSLDQALPNFDRWRSRKPHPEVTNQESVRSGQTRLVNELANNEVFSE
jgi:hypothetical protein